MNFYDNINHFTDVTIIFKDNKNKIELKLHKIILITYVPYFKKLFLNDFCDSKSDEIIINVTTAQIAYYVIMSFYGMKIDSNILNSCEYLLCKDFFGLSITKNEIINLDINNDNIEMFIDICYIYGYDELIDVFFKKIPNNYLNLIDDKLINEINEYKKYKIVITDNDAELYIYNLYNGELFKKIKCVSSCTYYYANNDYIICNSIFNNSSTYYVHSISDGKFIKKFDLDCDIMNTGYNLNKLFIACVNKNHDNYIIIYDFNIELINILNFEESTNKIKNIIFRDIYIIAYTNKIIRIYNTIEGTLFKSYNLLNYNKDNTIRISIINLNDKYLIVGTNDGFIYVISLHNDNVIVLRSNNSKIKCVLFAKDIIYSVNNNNELCVWNLLNSECINKTVVGNFIDMCICDKYNKLIVLCNNTITIRDINSLNIENTIKTNNKHFLLCH